MSYDIIKVKISQYTDKTLFLLDSSAFCKFEEIEKESGIHLLEIIHNSNKAHFFITNEVLVELMNGPRNLDIRIYKNHIINVEGSMDPNWKENRLLVEEDGELKYIIGNKVSNVDYNEIMLCQNHSELILVTNDQRMLKNGSRVLPGRIYGPPRLIERMIELEPNNTRLVKLQEVALQMYELIQPYKKKI